MGIIRFAAGLVLALSIAVVANQGDAMWAELSDEELVQTSELIATGTLIGTTRVTLSTREDELTLGVLQIQAVLKGDAGQEVALIVLPTPTPGFITTDLMTYETGQTGLWFLRSHSPEDQGLYLADHPQRFLPFDGAAEPIAKFKKLLAR